MSVRRLLRGFYRAVHPDLLHGYSSEVLSVNDRSLKELNAYVDRIEGPETVPAPFVSRKLQFFVPVLNKKSERLPGIARPVYLDLPSVGSSADMLEKEEAAVVLLSNVEGCMSMEDDRFTWKSSRSVSAIAPIIQPAASKHHPNDVRRSLDRIWRQEMVDSQTRDEIFNLSSQQDRFNEYRSIRLHNKLLAEYSKIKHPRKRALRIENIPSEVQSVISSESAAAACNSTSTPHAHPGFLRVIESGFHPDLVFLDPSLSMEQKQEGIKRVCGANLETESDIWLLENLWKVVRTSEYPAVPLVVSDAYAADLSGGYLRIPFNFILEPDLVQFLEENLDAVRAARKSLLEEFVAV